jgi:EAL domain-containing protein (putative c-di-GMP-specific phosphodiesterase class I)
MNILSLARDFAARQMGIGYAQGFFFGRPAEAESFG